MLRNEKGFMYPLTLCFFILFTTVLTLNIEHYLTEKRMLIETENILKQDYYLFKTVKSLEHSLAGDGIGGNSGSIEYDDGYVEYSIVELPENIREISIILKTGTDLQIRGYAYYDKSLQKMVRWKEIR